MKYAVIIPDGAADQPQPILNGRTPLEAANTPHLDRLAKRGVVARALHTPPALPAGSEIGNLSLLGYDPHQHFTGRAPMEAAAQDIVLEPGDWAVRCNLVQIAEQTMVDFTAGHISTGEASELLASMQAWADQQPQFARALEFRPGVSYRNLLVWRGSKLAAPFTADTRTRAPHDLTDLPVVDDFPRGPGSDVLVELMDASQRLFADHPCNQNRTQENKTTASHIWLWGQGEAPALEQFSQKFGPQGVMITAVDLLRGIAKLIGWPCLQVPGATGYLDTDYAAKGRYAVESLDNHDLVCVHIEAPDEASHEGRVDAKVEAIERIDEWIVGPLVEKLESCGDWRIMVSPDHPTYLQTKKHTHGYVPVVMAGTGIDSDSAAEYGDSVAAQSNLAFDQGHLAMAWFMARS
jgi:2,3-bisphosphoglycerate-independent phosphoglycerate mutase